MAYAHALIELADGSRIKRGDEVPADVDGFDALVESGAVSDSEYRAEDEPTQTPDYVEIDGVKYVKASDGASEDSNAS